MVKMSVYSVGDPGSIPGLGRSPGEGNGNLLQSSCLENPMDEEVWQVTDHGVAKSPTQLSAHSYTHGYLNASFQNASGASLVAQR